MQIVPLKGKKRITITYKFQKLLKKIKLWTKQNNDTQRYWILQENSKIMVRRSWHRIYSGHYVQLINKKLNIMVQSKKCLPMVIQILNLKMMIIWEYQNIKTFSEKITLQNALNIFFVINNLEIMYRRCLR